MSALAVAVTKSPVTRESGLGTASKVRWGWKPPSPLPSKTETSPARKLGTTTSGVPSPLKSATPICRYPAVRTPLRPGPTAYCLAAWKVPSALPCEHLERVGGVDAGDEDVGDGTSRRGRRPGTEAGSPAVGKKSDELPGVSYWSRLVYCEREVPAGRSHRLPVTWIRTTSPWVTGRLSVCGTPAGVPPDGSESRTVWPSASLTDEERPGPHGVGARGERHWSDPAHAPPRGGRGLVPRRPALPLWLPSTVVPRSAVNDRSDERVTDGCRPAADVDQVGLAGQARVDELAADSPRPRSPDRGHDWAGRTLPLASVSSIWRLLSVARGRRRHDVERRRRRPPGG